MQSKKDRGVTEMKVPLAGGVGVGPAGNTKRGKVVPDTSSPREVESKITPEEVPKEKELQDKAESYRSRLKQVGLTEAGARSILDAVLFKGSYSRVVPLTDNFDVEFGTRSMSDTMRAMRVVEAEAPAFQMHISDIVARYNLSASLNRYGEKLLPPRVVDDEAADEAAFQERLAFVLQLPEISARRLIDALRRFDAELAVVFSEGSIEDF